MRSSHAKRFDAQAFLNGKGDGRTIRRYRKNDIVFVQGEPAVSLCYVQRGEIKLTVVSPHGKEAIIGMLRQGAFFGETCLTDQAVRSATAVAITDTSVLHIKKKAMTRSLHDEPELSEIFIEHLLSRYVRTQEDLVDQLFNCSEKRLARILLLLADFGKNASSEIIPHISQEAFAEMIGTTRSRVSFFLNRFRKLGLIDYNHSGGMRVHASLLQVILDSEQSQLTPRCIDTDATPKARRTGRRPPRPSPG